jgi:putative ABC transport system ATP-binding protein
MTTVLTLRDLTRIHHDGDGDVIALADVDLSVGPGELVAVTGRSGCGKSTLLSLAGGLDQPTRGSVTVAGQALGAMRGGELARLRRRHVGYVFQDLNLLPTLTGLENVMLPLELEGASTADARRQAGHALEAVIGEDFADRYPDQLSGGQRQRVAIARALVGTRRLILADEPTGALDEVTAEGILRLIRARCDDGAAAVIVTHDPSQAAWADRVVRLRDGRVDSITERSDPDTVLATVPR